MAASWQRWKLVLAKPAVATLAILVVMALYAIPAQLGVPLFQRLEATSYDLRLILESRTRPIPQAPEIVIVEIDDLSLETIGRWPWPRQLWAEIVDQLAAMGARAVFFDVAFPDPASNEIQTRDGRVSLHDALENSIELAKNAIREHSVGVFEVTTPVAQVLERGFRELQADVRSYLPQPDAVVAGSLTLARRAGTVTGGVATIVDPGFRSNDGAEIRRAEARRRIAADPSRPIDELGPDILGSLAAETKGLELWRQACLLFAPDPSPYLESSTLSPELRAYAKTAMMDVQRELIKVWTLAALGDAPLDTLDVTALMARAIPKSYLKNKVTQTVVEQTLSTRLLEQNHLLRPEGRENLPGMLSGRSLTLPNFTLARGYDQLGADNEIKDSDGVFRSLPLLWDYRGKAISAAGLLLYLRLMSAPGASQLPALRIEPGPFLSIERLPGAPAGHGPLRVPLTDSGQMMVHWAGRFDRTFGHLPAHALLNYVRMLEERAEYFNQQSSVSQFVQIRQFRDLARSLTISAPDKPLSFDDLAALQKAAKSTLVIDRMFDASALPDRVTDTKSPRLPLAWLRFFNAFLEEREKDTVSGLRTLLDKAKLEADPAKRAAKELKYAEKFKSYYRNVHRVDEARRELEQRVRGKICMIGITASSSTDLAPIPFERQYPKVGSYANVLNTLLSERFIHRPQALAWRAGGLVDPGSLQLPLLILVCAMFAFVLPDLTSLRGLVWALFFSAAWAVAASALLILNGLWIDLVAPIMGASITYGIVVTARNRRTERVRSMFESYVDPRIVKVMVEDESLWRELGGHEKRITAFFSDIANFTTLSEMLSPQEVSQMLTDYLSPMTDIILAHDGTRDKYIGDAIVAFFGAPLPGEGHELQACLASIMQQERLVELKKKWKTDGVGWYAKMLAAGTDLNFRVGLNSGFAKVGNFGSLTSKNYTMIGDTVNLASRLEGANKEYGTLIMASEATIAGHRPQLVTRELDRLVVKGRHEAVRVFEVIGRTGQVAAHWPELLEFYERALGEYHRREFTRAGSIFAGMLQKWPDDGPTRVYLERCEIFVVTPPPDDWDGSFKMTHK